MTDQHVAAGVEADEDDMMGETAEGGDRGDGGKRRAVAGGVIILAAGVRGEAAGADMANRTDHTIDRMHLPPSRQLRI